jgi:hypothetical protein
MSTPPASRTSLIALSAALGAAIVAIAFLLGRESMRAPEAASETRAVGAPVPATQSDVTDEKQEPRKWPGWADLEEWNDVDEPAVAVVDSQALERIERRPDGTVLLSNRSNTEARPRATSKSPTEYGGSAVAAYFLRIDTIHSQSGAGDPNTFAMGLIKAGLGGSTAGFDELLRDTRRMEKDIRQVTPPPSCEGYHRESLAALAEGRELLEEMKTAFEERDFSHLTMIAQQASELQTRANALQEMREQIMGLAAVR